MRQRRNDIGNHELAWLHTAFIGAVAPGRVRKGACFRVSHLLRGCVLAAVFLAVYQGLAECCLLIKLY